MYRLKHPAILSYILLQESLSQYGYKHIVGMVGLWEHDTRQTKFCVCVDSFGIKYYSKDDAGHLMTCLGHHYKYTTDWDRKNYCGLTFDWHYDDGYVDISMLKYVPDSLKRLKHVPKKLPQYSLHEHVPI